MTKRIICIFQTLIVLCLTVTFSFAQKNDRKPNLVLIMADDIGFSDIGAYGSEIETPYIDRLANQGLRFTTFYNMAKCAQTRSSLLTGLYNGGNGAVHVANLTKEAGYTNIMSGKEHFVSWVPDYCKAENAFDHSFYFWATTEYFVPPSGVFSKPFFLEGKQIAPSEIEHEISPMYKTDFITDYALNWLDESFQKEDKPFFLYLPYHAAHYPLQARPEDIKKYRGKYKKGWDKLRKERFRKMKALGVISKNTKLSPPENNLNKKRGPLIPDYTDYYTWDSLTEAKKDSLDLEMAVFAAIVDRMDQNIGRVLNKLEKEGKLENTLIMFLIDNGSCPFYTNKVTDVPPGPANSYWSLRTTWANLGNTPYRQYKQAGHEGGSHTPFIAYWPNKIKPNTITNQPGHVVDMLPTFLDVLDLDYPKTIEGHPTIPFHGQSLLPVFKGKKRKEPDYFISGMKNYRMFRRGDFKIVQMNGGIWELYNIKKDPTELVNLAHTNPEKVKELADYFASSPLGTDRKK
ncbi:arylsulfatase [Seonamhaeicola maritimus]|uniref:arylsulfatase n=1 Tax=Seonamhaeicola maritimus TaxID=2591822 RepID=UPI00249424B4|nr:arylsulfatase [Seonamhaeicola maritimus]